MQDLKIAPMYKRILAFTIDDLIIMSVFMIVFVNMNFDFSTDIENLMMLQGQNEAFQIASEEFFKKFSQALIESSKVAIIVSFLYQFLFIWMFGCTIGKFFCKIKCVEFDGQKPNCATSILRSFIRIFSAFFYLGYIVAFFTSFKQTFHDFIAKTLVVEVD